MKTKKRSRKGDSCGFDIVERVEEERLPIAAFHGHVEGKRSRGRQRKIWMDNAKEYLKEKDINLARIGETIRNREVWRSLVRASSSAHLWRSEKKNNLLSSVHTVGLSVIIFRLWQFENLTRQKCSCVWIDLGCMCSDLQTGK